MADRFRIRQAQAGDAPALAALRYSFRKSIGEPSEDRDLFVGRCQLWMEQRLTGAGPWHVWVAEGEDGLWGHLWLQAIEKIPNPVEELELHAYVTNFYVVPDRQELGIGTRLLETALDWAKENDVDALFLWPTDRSRSLYLRHGFRESGRVLVYDSAAER
jgi:GNAT superfamily N-acetyltransferase